MGPTRHNIHFEFKGKLVVEGQDWERQKTAVNCVRGWLRWDTIGVPGVSLSKSYLSCLHFEGQQMSFLVCFKQIQGS